MKLALFIPCYVDQLYPQVGIAALSLLKSLGHEVEIPAAPRCCGQPLLNSGDVAGALPMIREFETLLDEFELIVCPSGSCVSMVRHHHRPFASDPQKVPRGRIVELCEFLYDIEKVDGFPHPFPHRVVLHKGCHGLRELQLGSPSEEGGQPRPDKISELLRRVPGLTLENAARPDECCGFGGAFAIFEPEVSCAMGRSRLTAFEESGAELVASADMSCLMHLEGLVRREKRPLKVIHVAEIFAGEVR